MKLNKLLTDEVSSTFTPLSRDAEGALKGGFGSVLGTASPAGLNATNNCQCYSNNCSCMTQPLKNPTNNCSCPIQGEPYTPIKGGNNCTCWNENDENNCSCSLTTTKGANGLLLPALF